MWTDADATGADEVGMGMAADGAATDILLGIAAAFPPGEALAPAEQEEMLSAEHRRAGGGHLPDDEPDSDDDAAAGA